MCCKEILRTQEKNNVFGFLLLFHEFVIVEKPSKCISLAFLFDYVREMFTLVLQSEITLDCTQKTVFYHVPFVLFFSNINTDTITIEVPGCLWHTASEDFWNLQEMSNISSNL